MTIVVNGQDREVAEALTLRDLLAQLNMAPEKVAVELNRRLVRTERYSTTVLKAGDQIEIVTFVGGG
jgi:sulfur carrier protein